MLLESLGVLLGARAAGGNLDHLPIGSSAEPLTGGRFRFSAVALVADKPNKNNRVYSRALLKRECERLRPAVEGRSLMGMTGYPVDGLILPLKEVSHIVTNLEVVPAAGDHVLWAVVETLDTPAGRTLSAILGADGISLLTLRPLGFGTGGVNGDGVFVVGDSYQMSSISVVPVSEAA